MMLTQAAARLLTHQQLHYLPQTDIKLHWQQIYAQYANMCTVSV